jgi:hypothetical protein
MLKKEISQAWWRTLLIPELRRLKQENLEFKANLGYVEGPCLKILKF